MLTQLHIQNIAVIHKAGIEFSRGLNVFTGETGAGKTILISAIDAVLGERTSKEIIRTGEDRALVSALFEDISPRARQKLAELGYSDDEGSVLISREIQQGGKGGCKINGMPATASILKEIASLLISIHGQRDSGQLLESESHLGLIDAYGGLAPELREYGDAYARMCEIRRSLAALEMDEAQKAQRIDMLTFQIGEIEAAGLEDLEEEESLLVQRGQIRNAESIRDALSAAYAALRGAEEEQGIDALMDTLQAAAETAARYIPAMEEMASRLVGMGYELAEFAQEIRTTLDDFVFDPRELNVIESRLDSIYKLKRKYGADIREILDYCEKAREELEAITTSEQRRKELAASLEAQAAHTAGLAARLTGKRQKAAGAFVRLVEKELAFLDMPSVKLSVERRERELSPSGADILELYIVTNVGEVPKPLSKIASGGEMARIMLAVKNVLAEKDDIATLIFDEVDTGVSGRAARKIGQKLGQVALGRQVICVTHLAQVAAFADHHLYIHKEERDGRTFTRITPLEGEGVVRELARITSGDMITDAALRSAEELRRNSRELIRA